MAKFLKKYIVLIVLIVLIIILILLRIFYENNDKSSVSVIPTPTEIPTPTFFETESEDVNPPEDYVSVLPYLGKKMQITGIKSPKVLEIIIENEEDKDEIIEEIELWKKQYPIFKDYTFEFTIRKLN